VGPLNESVPLCICVPTVCRAVELESRHLFRVMATCQKKARVAEVSSSTTPTTSSIRRR
jgi:hypothetical protein